MRRVFKLFVVVGCVVGSLPLHVLPLNIPSHVIKLIYIVYLRFTGPLCFVFIRWPVNHLRNALCKCRRLLSKSDLEEPVLANVISQPVGAIMSQNRKRNGTDVIARTRQAEE